MRKFFTVLFSISLVFLIEISAFAEQGFDDIVEKHFFGEQGEYATIPIEMDFIKNSL